MGDFQAIENITNATLDYEIPVEQSTSILIWEIIFAILSGFAICIDFATAYIILRFKKLRMVPYIFIANWAIADVCILIIARSNIRLIEFLEDIDASNALIVYFYTVEHIFRTTFMLFVLAALVDWCLASYCSRASQKFRKYYRFIIAFPWALNFLMLCISIALIYHDLYFHLPILFLFFGYLGSFLFIIVLHSLQAVQKCRKKSSDYPTLVLTLTTIILISSWIIFWFDMVIPNITSKFFWKVLELCELSTSVVTFVVLYRPNKEFQACFRQALKCSSNRYRDDISEFQNYPENINNENQPIETHIYQTGRG